MTKIVSHAYMECSVCGKGMDAGVAEGQMSDILTASKGYRVCADCGAVLCKNCASSTGGLIKTKYHCPECKVGEI